MSWVGNYTNTTEVIKEVKTYLPKDTTILGEIAKKSYGAILYETPNGVKDVRYFIFENNMYKDLPWAENVPHIPKQWVKQILPFATKFELEEYEAYQEYLKREKKDTHMEKAEFHIRLTNGFKKVNGYVATIKDNNGNAILIGFHKTSSKWVATHIDSGLAIKTASTKKECFQKVNNQETFDTMAFAIKRPEFVKHIEEMKQFLASTENVA